MTPSSAVPSALFQPLSIGPVTLPNRFVMPGMQRGWCEAGAPTERLGAYYRRRVEGGVALIVTESCAVDHPSATAQPAAARIAPDTEEAWARCLAPARAAGGILLMQLWHEGALRNDADGRTISPDGMGYATFRNGRAATAAELDELVEAYAVAATRARRIGAHGIEVHGAHGYMLDQFLWPVTNQRGDGHGGPDIAHRARLPARIVAAIRAACGPDFLISFRFSQWKEHDYSARIVESPDELAGFAALLRDAGVDLFHASTRRFWTPEWPGDPRGLAGWTQALSGVPTIAVGSVGLDRDVMESFTRDGEATGILPGMIRELEQKVARGEFDLVAVGRSLISDPDWVAKVRDGRLGDIRVFQKSDLGAMEWELPQPFAG